MAYFHLGKRSESSLNPSSDSVDAKWPIDSLAEAKNTTRRAKDQANAAISNAMWSTQLDTIILILCFFILVVVSLLILLKIRKLYYC